MQSGMPYRVCVQTGLGYPQRADRVNSRVNCVSGGPHRDVALPPGNTKQHSTEQSLPHTQKAMIINQF